MNSDHPATPGGFVLAADEAPAFWFLNTLTINKIGRRNGHGQLGIVDHRVPAGFSPPPHIHQDSDEAFFILDGQFTGFCADRSWEAGPGSLVFLPHGIPHGFRVSPTSPGRALLILSPGGFEEFVAAPGKPAQRLHLPEPTAPDPAHVTQIAAAHGIQIPPAVTPDQGLRMARKLATSDRTRSQPVPATCQARHDQTLGSPVSAVRGRSSPGHGGEGSCLSCAANAGNGPAGCPRSRQLLAPAP